MENSNDKKLLEVIEAFIKVKKGQMKKESLKKRFGIGAKRYDEMRLNIIKSNHLIPPLAIYTQAEIDKLSEPAAYLLPEGCLPALPVQRLWK